MTKRFTLKYINEQHISANLYDNGTFIGSIGIGEELILEVLNYLSKENEELKQELISLRVELDTHKHPLWSTREAERIINEYEKENDELKQENRKLKEDLEHCANQFTNDGKNVLLSLR